MWVILFLWMMWGFIWDGVLEIIMFDGQVEWMGDESDLIWIMFLDFDLFWCIFFSFELVVGEVYMDEILIIVEDDFYGFIVLGVCNFVVGYGEGLELWIVFLKCYFE